jgi:hypothetical protein
MHFQKLGIPLPMHKEGVLKKKRKRSVRGRGSREPSSCYCARGAVADYHSGSPYRYELVLASDGHRHICRTDSISLIGVLHHHLLYFWLYDMVSGIFLFLRIWPTSSRSILRAISLMLSVREGSGLWLQTISIRMRDGRP